MQHRVHRRTTVLAAAMAVAGLTAGAGAQQGYRPRTDRPDQHEQTQPWSQQSGQPQDPEFLGRGTIVVIGVDMDQDGQADAMYFVPGSIVQQLAREHRNQERAGGLSMQMRPRHI